METVEIIGYEWCYCPNMLGSESEYEFIKTTSGRIMVYCQMERYQTQGYSGGFRVVPVPKEDIRLVP